MITDHEVDRDIFTIILMVFLKIDRVSDAQQDPTEHEQRLASGVDNGVGVNFSVVLHEIIPSFAISKHRLLSCNHQDCPEHSTHSGDVVSVGGKAGRVTEGDAQRYKHEHEEDRVKVLLRHITLVQRRLDEHSRIDPLSNTESQHNNASRRGSRVEGVVHFHKVGKSKDHPKENKWDRRFEEPSEIFPGGTKSNKLGAFVVSVVQHHHHRHHATAGEETQKCSKIPIDGEPTCDEARFVTVRVRRRLILIKINGGHAKPEHKPSKHKHRPPHVVHHRVWVRFGVLLPIVSHFAVFPQNFH
eukprot:m.261365 g.261365  ORF g.261365 m.261365 type:complete len:300 (-) comp42017_c0_seq1:838-1737(-)